MGRFSDLFQESAPEADIPAAPTTPAPEVSSDVKTKAIGTEKIATKKKFLMD